MPILALKIHPALLSKGGNQIMGRQRFHAPQHFGRAEPEAARSPSTNPTATQPFLHHFNILFLVPRFPISISFYPFILTQDT